MSTAGADAPKKPSEADVPGGRPDVPRWLSDAFPAWPRWRTLRACRLRVDADAGAGLEMEEGEWGYHIDKVAGKPGQDPALQAGDAIIAIEGERLFGLGEAQVGEAFGSRFRDGAEVLLLRIDELREAAKSLPATIERDSARECPCEVPGQGAEDADGEEPPVESNPNYELLHRAKSSTEYEATVRIPVARGTVWSLGPEQKAMLDRDLEILGQTYNLKAEPKLNRDGHMESVVLTGLSTGIATARPEVIQILNFYREGKWADAASGGGPIASTGDQQGGHGAPGEGAVPEVADDGTLKLPAHVKDLRQFEYHDHTADIIVHAWGVTRAEAFAQVVVGMFNYMTPLDKVQMVRAVEVEATGHDLLDLLYHLLDEFLYVFGTEMHLSRCVEILEFDEEGLRIRARGYGERMNLKKHEQGTEIKAITMHMMKILSPECVLTENGTAPLEAVKEDIHEGYPHQVYVLLDI